MKNNLIKYVTLLDRYLNHEVSLKFFRNEYFHQFKSEGEDLSENCFSILDKLFGELDSCTSDPDLLSLDPDFYLTEPQLRVRVEDAKDRISKLLAATDNRP